MVDQQRTYGTDTCDDAGADAFLRSISADLEAFSSLHQLTIWKYPHQAPMWVFHFLHPAGGFARLQLYCLSAPKNSRALSVSISGDWYLDDHEKRLRRHYPYGKPIEVLPDSEGVLNGLADQLGMVLRCPVTDLVPTEYSYVPTGNDKGNDRLSDFELSLRVAI